MLERSANSADAAGGDLAAALAALRGALPEETMTAAARCAGRLHERLGLPGPALGGKTVLVGFGGGKDSSYALAFVRAMQLLLHEQHGATFRLRSVTNRHAGMPDAVLSNMDRVYQALGLLDDPHCELLLVDGEEVKPFGPQLPLPHAVRVRNRTDILMTGHRTSGDGRPTFCNACNLSMVKAFGLAAAYAGGVDAIITGDSPEEQRDYAVWVNRLARRYAKDPASRSNQSARPGFAAVLEKFDGVSRQYFADIHGQANVDPAVHGVPTGTPDGVVFFSVYDDTDYSSGSHWEFLTGYLGFVFDELAFSFTESDCGNPALMAHLRGLKCERRFGRSYDEGLAEYIEFATELMRRKDFPEHLIEVARARYAGTEGVARMRKLIAQYALDTFGFSEEQLVCMVFAPFAGQGAGLREYLHACRPDLADRQQEIERILNGDDEDGDLIDRLCRMSGLDLAQLRRLYAAPLSRHGDASLLDAILDGDPHKTWITTRHAPGGPPVREQLSGR